MIRMLLDTSRPVFCEMDPESFGILFASLGGDEQAAVLTSIAKKLSAHPMQHDFIAMELTRPGNEGALDMVRTWGQEPVA
jgi:hypothetical protein